MIINGKNVCNFCKACFTCGTPRRTLTINGKVEELCPKCYNKESNK